MSFSRNSYIKEAKSLNHSPEFIEETLEYAQNLIDQNLPVIFSTKHLSLMLSIDYTDLVNIILEREHHYKYYQIRKRRGGVRQISSPYADLKLIQRWINDMILSNVPLAESAKGFIPKKSIKDNALPHSGKKVILNVDLLKYFDSITEHRVYGIFKRLGYHKNLAVDLAKLTTVEMKYDYFKSFSDKEQKIFSNLYYRKVAVLPQGAPTSPTLSNIASKELDEKLFNLSQESGSSYSRYADDMTFSSDDESDLPSVNEIVGIIKEEKLFVNWNKVKKYKKGQRQLVTGLTISDGVHIPKKFKKEIRRHLHFCIKYDPESHMKRLGKSELGYYREWLLGKIYYIKSIEPELGNKLIWEFNKINWSL